MSQLSTDLAALHALIATSWRAGGLAHDAGNALVEPLDPGASTWSLIGACLKTVAGDVARSHAMLDALRDQTAGFGVVCYDLVAGRNVGQVNALVAQAAAAAPAAVTVG